ncbi:MAG: AI-2E family transporter [Lachnospiraceae bacterium]|nr:AI-2E family transporter [Lachnospiraceae bacterium]
MENNNEHKLNMNRDEKKKYFHIGLTVFLTAVAIMVVLLILMNLEKTKEALSSLLQIAAPIINGLVLTYFMAPIVNAIEEKWIYKKHSAWLFKGKEGEAKGKVKSRVRVFSIFLTYMLFLLVVFGMLALVIPEISKSIQSIIKNYPNYMVSFQNWADNMAKKHPGLEQNFYEVQERYSDTISEWINTNVLGKVNELLTGLLSGGLSILRGILDFVIGMIIALYLLGSKELMIGRCKKVIYALMRKDMANAFIHNVRFTNKTFLDFFGGKVIDSLIIGFLCFIITSILGTPYALLISVIIGVTNIIPFFGPFIGAIPSAFLVLLVDPKQCLIFVIMILILQQLDGNVIGPLILGQKTGLSGFWVIFAITIFGGLFSFAGMLLGVPVFAVIYTGVNSYIKAKLQTKGLDIDTKRYVHVDYIDDDGNYVRLPKEEVNKVMSRKDFKKTFGKNDLCKKDEDKKSKSDS